MAIKEIKRPRSKSHRDIISTLQAALNYARENQCISIAISLRQKDEHYTDFRIVPGTDYHAVIGALDSLRDIVKEAWNDEDD